MTQQDTRDPELVAASSNCLPGCPGVTAGEYGGITRPHDCRRTLAALGGPAATAEAFVAEHLAQTAALADEREGARTLAAHLEAQLAALRTSLQDALSGCPDHDPPLVGCAVCTLDAWAQTGRDEALYDYLATRADE